MTSFIEQLLAEAESELVKEANDANGAPDNASQQEQGSGDINTTAQAFLQKVEQFKAQLGQNVAGAEQQQQDPNAPVDPNAEVPVDPNAQPQAEGSGAIIIQRPDGTVVKLAELQKLASLRSSFKKGV